MTAAKVRGLAALLVCVCFFSWPRGARAQSTAATVTVEVVDHAGGRAYLQPGRKAGLKPGVRVKFGQRTVRILEVSDGFAVVADEDAELRLKQEGKARVAISADKTAKERVLPLSRFRGQWKPAKLPANAQQTRLVSIGVTARNTQYELALLASVMALVPASGATATVQRTEVRAIAHAEPLSAPLGLDADIAAIAWDAPDDFGQNARPNLFVRELRLRYGDRYRPTAALGRLRYAALTVGLLDGVRVETSVADTIRVGAFGGVVPDLQDGRPGFSASVAAVSRFGVELTYFDPTSNLRPFVNLEAHGSMFQGALDERRLTASVHMFPGHMALRGYAEVAAYDPDNAWGALPVEVNAAGIDARLRVGNAFVGARVDARQPELSRWLVAELPQSWLCSPTALPADQQPEPCSGRRDLRALASLDAGADFRKVSVVAGANLMQMSEREKLQELGGFVDVHSQRVFASEHLELGLMGTHSPLLDSWGVRLGGGSAFLDDRLDVAAHYRVAQVTYYAQGVALTEQDIELEGRYVVDRHTDVGLVLVSTSGVDAPRTLVLATAAWRL